MAVCFKRKNYENEEKYWSRNTVTKVWNVPKCFVNEINQILEFGFIIIYYLNLRPMTIFIKFVLKDIYNRIVIYNVSYELN